MFGLADVYFQIFLAIVNTDDHPCVDLDTWPNQQFAARLSSLQGIDNDFSFGTLRYAELKSDGGLLKLPQMEIDGLCTLPCVDEQAVTAIQALNDEIVKHAFADLLSSAEIDALLDRLHGVQNILHKTAAKKKDFVVPGKDWNEDTLRRFGRVQNANPYVKREYI